MTLENRPVRRAQANTQLLSSFTAMSPTTQTVETLTTAAYGPAMERSSSSHSTIDLEYSVSATFSSCPKRCLLLLYLLMLIIKNSTVNFSFFIVKTL